MEFQTAPNSIQRAAVEGLSRVLGLPSASVSYTPRPDQRSLSEDFSLRGIAMMCAENASQQEKGLWSSGQDFVARAMTTSDFANIMADVANKQLLASYNARPASFTKWASKGSLTNFKPAHVDRITAPGTLPELGELQEYKALKLEDGSEVVYLKTFGGLLAISRHTIINDDLDALKDRSNLLTQSAALTQAKIASEALTANPNMSDGVALFHADRKNLLTGPTSVLSADSLAKAISMMRSFANETGHPLLVEPKYLVVGPGNERLAYQLAFSDSDPSAPNSGALNYFKQIGVQPVVDPLLESPVITGGSATAWYLLPDPAIVPVVRYFTLGGAGLAPYIESRSAFNNDCVEMKTRIDFSAAPIGTFAVKSAGA